MKNWCFWTVVLENTLESPWTGRGSNQSIVKEISPEYSLEGLMLKLKLQYFGHLMQRTDSTEKTLMLGKIKGRRMGQQRMRWLNDITNSMHKFEQTLGVGDGQGGLAVHGVAMFLTRPSNWTKSKSKLPPEPDPHSLSPQEEGLHWYWQEQFHMPGMRLVKYYLSQLQLKP